MLPIIDNGNGNVKANFVISIFTGFHGVDIMAERFSDSLAPRARNRAAASFLKTDRDYLLFIDGDIHFGKQHIEWLAESPHPITAGLYCKKEAGIAPCLNTLPGHQDIPVGGYIELARAGTGFMRIHREVLEKMIAHPNLVPEYLNHGQPEWDFFPTGVKNAEYRSEDWAFCDIARELGYKIMLDSRIQLRHEGMAIFPMLDHREDLTPEQMKIAAPLTPSN